MKCQVCLNEILPELNSLVCSDRCAAIRLKVHELIDKYTPTPGCDNCRGDLYRGCTDKCQREFAAAGKFGTDLWGLVRMSLEGTELIAKARRIRETVLIEIIPELAEYFSAEIDVRDTLEQLEMQAELRRHFGLPPAEFVEDDTDLPTHHDVRGILKRSEDNDETKTD
jgi:hypothetical protein